MNPIQHGANGCSGHAAPSPTEPARAHWSKAPCGSNYSDAAPGTKEYYDQIEAHRYGSHPWIKAAIDGFDIAGKEVLEVGYGMGTDHLNLARRGAHMHGIDLTPRNREIVESRLAMYGLRSELHTGDAEQLPYEDNRFDLVYTFGVIHHFPDTERAVAEIRRVLKPGGRCWATVYHRNSIFFWWTVFLWSYLIGRQWRRLSLQQRLSMIEYPGTSTDLVVHLYRRREANRLFASFASVAVTVEHLIPLDIAWVQLLYRDPHATTPLLRFLGRRFGWYVIADARK